MQATLDGKEVVDHAGRRHGAATDRRFGRRALIVGGAVAGTAAVVAGVLAVTGGDSSGSSGDDGGDGGGGGIGTGDSEVRILNWQAYIDPTEDGAVGTIDRFREATGIDVTYDEDFNDNNEVYNRILAPVLGTGGRHRLRHHLPDELDGGAAEDPRAGSSSSRSTGSRTGSTSRTGS